MAILAVIPIIGTFFRKIHLRIHTKLNHPCHKSGCNKNHAEHRSMNKYHQAVFEEYNNIKNSELNESIVRYVIINTASSDETLFWERNMYAGYTSDNKQVYSPRFVNELSQAHHFNNQQSAEIIFHDFQNGYCPVSFNISCLNIKPIKILYEIKESEDF